MKADSIAVNALKQPSYHQTPVKDIKTPIKRVGTLKSNLAYLAIKYA